MFGNMMPQNMFGFDPSNINTGLIMGGLGMLTGQNPQQQFQQGMQGYITGSAMDQDRRDRKSEEERKRLWNEAVAKYGQGKFSPEETALMGLNPDLAQSVIANRMTPQAQDMPSFGFTEMDGTLLRTDPRTGMAEPVYQSPTAGEPEAPKFSDITAARKDYESQPGTSRYRASAPILQSMASAVTDTSAMSDVEFVYGMAQIFDPDSVVRESEMGFVIESQSMPAQLKGQLQKILNGEAVLQPQLRKDLVNAAARRVGEYRAQAEKEAEFFTGISERNRLNPMDIIRPLEPMPNIQDLYQRYGLEP